MPFLLSLALAGSAAVAQPDPLDARAPVPPVRHVTTLRSRPADTPPGDWKQANDAVLKAGGWKAYAREAAASEPRR